MQAVPISQRATDIGQLFVGVGGTAIAAGSQASEGTASGEGAAGSFFAALTLGEGEGELGDEEAQGDGAAFDFSAEQGSEEQHDPRGEGLVAVPVSEETAAVLGEAPQIAQGHGAVTPRLLWPGIETGPPEPSVVVAEPVREVPEARRADDVSRRGPDAMALVGIIARVPAQETSDAGAVPRQRPVPGPGAVGDRDFTHRATAVVRGAVPQMTLSQVLMSEAPVSRASPTQSPPEVAVPEVLIAEDAMQRPQAEQAATVAHDRPSRAGSDAQVKREAVGEGKVKALGDLPAAVDRQVRDVRQSEATAKAPPVQAAPVRRDHSTERDIDLSRLVRADSPQPHTGAGRGEQVEGRPVVAASPREPPPEQSQGVGSAPVEKGSIELEQPRPSRLEKTARVQVEMREAAERRPSGVTETRLASRLPHANSDPPPKDDAIEKLVREFPVENATREALKRTDRPVEHPQDGKVVENSAGEPMAKAAGPPEQRVELEDKARIEVPVRVGERAVFGEEARPEPTSIAVAPDAVKYASHRAAEVPGQRSAAQSDDRQARPREPELQQPGQVLSSARKARVGARTGAVDIEAYRLTMAADGKEASGATESLKSFRNNGLEEVATAQAGNPQPVDKKSKGHELARLESAVEGGEVTEQRVDFGHGNRRVDARTPRPVTEGARLPRADQARPLLGAEQDGGTETDADREGSAVKRPVALQAERSEQQAHGLDRTELHSEMDADPAQPRKHVEAAPLVKPSKAVPRSGAGGAATDGAKADLQTVNAPAPKAVG